MICRDLSALATAEIARQVRNRYIYDTLAPSEGVPVPRSSVSDVADVGSRDSHWPGAHGFSCTKHERSFRLVCRAPAGSLPHRANLVWRRLKKSAALAMRKIAPAAIAAPMAASLQSNPLLTVRLIGTGAWCESTACSCG